MCRLSTIWCEKQEWQHINNRDVVLEMFSIIIVTHIYRPRSKGDNAFGSVRPSVNALTAIQNGWAFKMDVVSTGCAIVVDHAFNWFWSQLRLDWSEVCFGFGLVLLWFWIAPSLIILNSVLLYFADPTQFQKRSQKRNTAGCHLWCYKVQNYLIASGGITTSSIYISCSLRSI